MASGTRNWNESTLGVPTLFVLTVFGSIRFLAIYNRAALFTLKNKPRRAKNRYTSPVLAGRFSRNQSFGLNNGNDKAK